MNQSDPNKTGKVGLEEFLAFYQKYAKINENEFAWKPLSAFSVDFKYETVFI
jgi:hypothetical protein